ncbi:hypothetical protein FRC09_003491 [Ceratobasidium sp. 395]|nr:hypothetical protein FRC09_003491 [Ceratobasidium sp. 395]
MISLEVSTEPLSQALRSASAAHEVIVKLAKKNDQPSRQGKKMLVTHDVRITVMKAADMEQVKEPLCPPPDLHIILPSLKGLRTIVEHMQHLSDVVAFSATRSGELVLAIQTDDVRVSTAWEGCLRPTIEGEPPEDPENDENRDQKFGALLAVKSLLKFLTVHMFSSSTVACRCTVVMFALMF